MKFYDKLSEAMTRNQSLLSVEDDFRLILKI